ncbi:MAG: hypothetical protein ACK5Y6_02380, partial [Pseudomonadota bacterium]
MALALNAWHKWSERDYYRRGLILSVVGHFVLAAVMLVRFSGGFGEIPEPVVYSISIEGGKTIGGMSQVPKDDKPSPIAPVKNVAAQSEPAQETKKEQPK